MKGSRRIGPSCWQGNPQPFLATFFLLGVFLLAALAAGFLVGTFLVAVFFAEAFFSVSFLASAAFFAPAGFFTAAVFLTPVLEALAPAAFVAVPLLAEDFAPEVAVADFGADLPAEDLAVADLVPLAEAFASLPAALALVELFLPALADCFLVPTETVEFEGSPNISRCRAAYSGVDPSRMIGPPIACFSNYEYDSALGFCRAVCGG